MPDTPVRSQSARLLTAVCLITVAAFCAADLWVLGGDLRHSDWAFGSDEGLHAMWARSLATDLQRGDLAAFARDLYRQDRWPPLSKLLQVPLILLLPPSANAHRLAILTLLPLALVPFWLLGCHVARRHRDKPGTGGGYQSGGEERRSPVAVAVEPVPTSRGTPGAPWGAVTAVGGMLACLFALTSPEYLGMGTSVMVELPGLAILMGAYYCYLRGVAGADRRHATWGGWLLTAAWFCKWQYGMLATLVTLADLLLAHGLRPGRALRAPHLWRFYAPALICVGAWMANPVKLREYLMYTTWWRWGPSLLSGERTLFWLRLLWDAYTAGPVAALLCGLGLLTALLRPRDPAHRLLILHAAGAFALTIMRHGQDWHVGLWYAPPLWVLGAGFAAGVVSRASSRGRAWEVVAVGLVVALFAVLAPTSVTRARSVRDNWVYPERYWQVYDWIGARTSPEDRIVTLGGWTGPLNPFAMMWWFMVHRGSIYEELEVREWPPPEPPRPGRRWRLPWRVRLEGHPEAPMGAVEALERGGTTALVVLSFPPEPLNADQRKILGQVLRPGSPWRLTDSWRPAWGGEARLYRKLLQTVR